MANSFEEILKKRYLRSRTAENLLRSRFHTILTVHPILTTSTVLQNHRLVCEYQIVTLRDSS